MTLWLAHHICGIRMVVRGEEAADTVNAAIKAGMIKGGYFELDGTADTGFFFFVRGTESSTPG